MLKRLISIPLGSKVKRNGKEYAVSEAPEEFGSRYRSLTREGGYASIVIHECELLEVIE